MAEAHFVTVGSFIGKEIAPVLGKSYLTGSSESGGSRFYEVGYEINELGKLAEDFAQCLSDLTGCSTLRSLTLLSWNGVIPARGLFRQSKAWCPMCLEDWEKNKREIYEPLLWNFKEVNSCAIHGIKLKMRCPNCRREIPVLSRKSRNGFCSFCGCWLGSPDYNQDERMSLEQASWEYFVVINIESLLKIGSDLSFSPSGNNIYTFLKTAIDKAGGKGGFSRGFGIPKTTVRTWYDGKHKPSLHAILKICYRLNCNIAEIFKLNQSYIGFETTRKESYALTDILPTQTTRKRRKFDWYKVETLLRDVSDNKSVPPPSVNEVARNIKCDKKLLYNHFPALCKKISENHSLFLQMRKSKRIEEDCQKVSEATVILYNSGVYPSRRRVEGFLSPKIILREKAYQMTWKKTLVDLGSLELKND